MSFSQDLKTRLTLALAEPAAATELEAAVSAATGEISDVAYNATTWNDVTAIGASKNALRDKIVAMDAVDALKAPLASPTFTGTIGTALTVSKALSTDGSGNLAASGTSSVELGYVSGVTSAIQTQLNAKLTASQATNVAAEATADATDLATVIALANAMKVTLNAEIAALKAASVQASS